jgi:S1-C subfamily serine protease
MLKKVSLCITFLFCSIAPAFIAAASHSHLSAEEKVTINIFKQVSPRVVNIHNIQRLLSPYMNPFDIEVGGGSGFIWDKQGHIVTNFHVVRNASRLAISIAEDQEEMHVKVVGFDERKDIAVLKLIDQNAITQINKNLPPLTIANSAQLEVGETAIAIGNPFGLDRTLTKGVVSALDRRVPGIGGVSIHNMIQTDASINPGNSGGPLLNSRGELIGMNTIIFSRSGTSSGIGFAVPSNEIKRVVEQLIRNGKVSRPGIGVQIFTRSGEQELRNLGVNIQGVLIRKVMPHTPAEKAGLRGTQIRQTLSGTQIQVGDMIIGVNQQKISSYDELINILDDIPINSKITLSILREGKLMTLHDVKLIDVGE